MEELPIRVSALVQVLVPFVLFMAATYLLLHIVFARLVHRENPALWFFGVVTRPLTRPVQALMPPGTPERRVRAVALLVYLTLWAAARTVLAWLGPSGMG